MCGPWALIIVCGAIGAWVWDRPGAYGGLAVGFVLAMALGRIVEAIKGGVLPRKERERVTELFINEYSLLINAAFPDEQVDSFPKLVSDHIEQIFKKAMAEGAPGSLKSIGRGNVQGIARQIAQEQTDPEKREYWYTLWEFVEVELYPE